MAPGADRLGNLVQALLDEERARGEVRAALNRQVNLLRQLRAEGLPLTLVAYRVSRARGLALSVADRIRLGERLRKRASRRTCCPLDSAATDGQAASTTSRSENRAIRSASRSVKCRRP